MSEKLTSVGVNYESVKAEVFGAIEKRSEDKGDVESVWDSIKGLFCTTLPREILTKTLDEMLTGQDCKLNIQELSENLSDEEVQKLQLEVQKKVIEVQRQKDALAKHFEELEQKDGKLALNNPDPDFEKRDILEVFTPLSMQVHVQKNKGKEGEEKYEVVETPVTLETIIFDPDELEKEDKKDEKIKGIRNKFLIQGVVGAGKTTMLRHFVKQNLERYKTKGRIPVVLTASEVLDSLKENEGIEALMPKGLSIKGAKVDFFIDGLDESKDPNKVLSALKSFENKDYNFIIGSRYISETEKGDVTDSFQKISIDNIAEDSTRDEFIGNYLSNTDIDRQGVPKVEMKEKHARVLIEFVKNLKGSLGDLLKTPGGLMHMCIMFKGLLLKNNGDLKKVEGLLKNGKWTAAEVYQESVDYILGKYEWKKPGVDRYESLREYKQVFSCIAFVAFENGNIDSPRISSEVFETGVKNYVEGLKDAPADLYKDLCEQVILSNIVRRVGNEYEFIHLSYKEYFTAEYLAMKSKKVTQYEDIVKGYNEEEKKKFVYTEGEVDIFKLRGRDPSAFNSNSFQQVLNFYVGMREDEVSEIVIQFLKRIAFLDNVEIDECVNLGNISSLVGEEEGCLQGLILAVSSGLGLIFFDILKTIFHKDVFRFLIRGLEVGGSLFFQEAKLFLKDIKCERSKLTILERCLRVGGNIFFQEVKDFLLTAEYESSKIAILKVCAEEGFSKYFPEAEIFLGNSVNLNNRTSRNPNFKLEYVCDSKREMELRTRKKKDNFPEVEIFRRSIEKGNKESYKKAMEFLQGDASNVDKYIILRKCLDVGGEFFYQVAHSFLQNGGKDFFHQRLLLQCLNLGGEEFYPDTHSFLQNELRKDLNLDVLNICLEIGGGEFYPEVVDFLKMKDSYGYGKRYEVLIKCRELNGGRFIFYVCGYLDDEVENKLVFSREAFLVNWRKKEGIDQYDFYQRIQYLIIDFLQEGHNSNVLSILQGTLLLLTSFQSKLQSLKKFLDEEFTKDECETLTIVDCKLEQDLQLITIEGIEKIPTSEKELLESFKIAQKNGQQDVFLEAVIAKEKSINQSLQSKKRENAPYLNYFQEQWDEVIKQAKGLRVLNPKNARKDYLAFLSNPKSAQDEKAQQEWSKIIESEQAPFALFDSYDFTVNPKDIALKECGVQGMKDYYNIYKSAYGHNKFMPEYDLGDIQDNNDGMSYFGVLSNKGKQTNVSAIWALKGDKKNEETYLETGSDYYYLMHFSNHWACASTEVGQHVFRSTVQKVAEEKGVNRFLAKMDNSRDALLHMYLDMGGVCYAVEPGTDALKLMFFADKHQNNKNINKMISSSVEKSFEDILGSGDLPEDVIRVTFKKGDVLKEKQDVYAKLLRNDVSMGEKADENSSYIVMYSEKRNTEVDLFFVKSDKISAYFS